jgi:hypothetical protein
MLLIPPGDFKGYTQKITLDARTTREFHCAEYKLDFNKWIYEGVSFTNEIGEEVCRKDAEFAQGEDHVFRRESNETIVVRSESDKLFVNAAMDGLSTWLRGVSSCTHCMCVNECVAVCVHVCETCMQHA